MHPLLSAIERHAAADPDALAVGDELLALTRAQLCGAARGLARRIRERSTAPHVGILAPTSAAGAAAILACWYAGAVPTPLNVLLPPADLARITADAGLDLILASERLAPLARSAGRAALILEADSLTPAGGAAPAARGEDTAALLYTSGTAGEPKGVRLSFDNVVGNAHASIEHMRLDPRQVFLSVLPQFHSFGFTAMTVVPLVCGASVWCLPRFVPATVVETIARRRASVFMGVASMYAALLHVKSAGREALESLTLAISGGEPLPAAVADAFHERFGVAICEGYGLTETSPVVSINAPWARKPGSVGKPLPGVSVSACAADGIPLPTGSEGELVVRGPCVMQGYHNRPRETAEVLRDGALFTGDVGFVDADGFVHVTGRAKDMIIVAGENVFPREIEDVLARHPDVAEVAVVGAPDPLRGETPLAFVLLRPGARADAAQLRAYCRERLAGCKTPREVRICEALPRGPTGKILKRALRELA